MKKRNIDLLREERSKTDKLLTRLVQAEAENTSLTKERDKLSVMLTDARKQRDTLLAEVKMAEKARKQISVAVDAIMLSVARQFGKDGEVTLQAADMTALAFWDVSADKDPSGGYRIVARRKTDRGDGNETPRA